MLGWQYIMSAFSGSPNHAKVTPRGVELQEGAAIMDLNVHICVQQGQLSRPKWHSCDSNKLCSAAGRVLFGLSAQLSTCHGPLARGYNGYLLGKAISDTFHSSISAASSAVGCYVTTAWTRPYQSTLRAGSWTRSVQHRGRCSRSCAGGWRRRSSKLPYTHSALEPS